MNKKSIVLMVGILLLFFSLGHAQGGFEDNGDGTISDTGSGLMWQQRTAGPMSWGDAMTYCETLRLGGYEDWRLPGRGELRSLIALDRKDPAIDTAFFPDTKQDHYWTSDMVQLHEEKAWQINFAQGHEYEGFKSTQFYVRAVRDDED